MIISNYEIGKEIGSGAFGTVNIAEDRKTGEKVAVKCISKSRIQRSNMGPQVKKEITTMKKLNHPNIVRIKEVLMSNSHLYLVLEYAGGGELFTKIAQQGKLSEKVAKRYFRQIMDAVKFCHNLYVCHRDIKPENILLDYEDNVKIADFGFASVMEPEIGTDFGKDSNESERRLKSIDENADMNPVVEPLSDFVPDAQNRPSPRNQKFRNLPSKRMQRLSTMCGTTQYMAPEIVNRDSYRGDKADIWSCGVVLFVLIAGYLPFDSNNSEIVIQKIKTGKFDTPAFVSDLARDVITKLLTPNPLFRPGAKTILDHEWLRDTGKLFSSPLPSQETKSLPRFKSKLPAAGQRSAVSKLVAKEQRKIGLNLGMEEAVSRVVGVLQTSAWMQKAEERTASSSSSSSSPPSIVKGSKMTSTGLAMIQIVFQSEKNDTMTTVEVDVFGRQKNSGAREINKLVADIDALREQLVPQQN